MKRNSENQPSKDSDRNYFPLDISMLCPTKKTMPKFLAEELVNDVFEVIKKKNSCAAKISSSECHNDPKKFHQHGKDEEDDMDPRLKAWQKMLKERKVLQQRIEHHTGKRAEDVLFNRHATIDEQAKHMIIHLLDTAVRSEGVPPARVKGVLKMRQEIDPCREIRELHPTEPKLRPLEFVGLPNVTQLELAATLHPPETKWMRSEALGERLEQEEDNIIRVLSHCPSLNQLQISSLPQSYPVPVADSQRLDEEMLYHVSSETIKEVLPEEEAPPPLVTEKDEKICQWEADNMIIINGTTYGFGVDGGSMSGDVSLYFQCDPLHLMRKTIVHLQNIGSKFIQIRWVPNSMHNKELQQHMAFNSEFIFDSQSFVLLPGHQKRIDVLYQPTKVGVKKQRWCMSLQRSPFCGIRYVFVRFHGVCTQPVIYRERLDLDQRLVVNKRTRQVAERLTKMQAELAPIVQRPSLSCPYERVLDERELFSAQNMGYKCERYADLETLKELYALVKKPRQPAWDYRLETLRRCIYQHEVKQRESLQNILIELLGPMRCNASEAFTREHSDPQRERSCFVYVRGIVCSVIEEWENIGEGLGQQFFRAELQRYVNELQEQGQKMPTDSDYVERFVSKRVLGCKYFKDALYIQTYTLMCDAAENIVSAIESAGNL